jgi:hypothetical protein
MKQNEKSSGIIFCDQTGKWKEQLQRRLQTQEIVSLAALGEVRYDLLRHLHKRKDIEIIKLETRYMKTREKGLGLRVTIRKLPHDKSESI